MNDWPTNKQESDWMERLARTRKTTAAEQFLAHVLRKHGFTFTMHARWGYRVFDFWIAALGVAIVIDEPKSPVDPAYARSDEDNLNVSGIVTIHVRPFNAADSRQVFRYLRASPSWQERRVNLGITKEKFSRATRELVHPVPLPDSGDPRHGSERAHWKSL